MTVKPRDNESLCPGDADVHYEVIGSGAYGDGTYDVNGIPQNTYTVAINSWLASGGDGYKIFTELPGKEDLKILHREIVYQYIKKMKIIEPYIDGRINITE
jgi:hypothetical protein